MRHLDVFWRKRTIGFYDIGADAPRLVPFSEVSDRAPAG
jgi:hypothetical protein